MQIQLRKHGTKLEDEAAVVAREMNGTLKKLSWRPVFHRVVAIEPVLNLNKLDFVGFFVPIADVATRVQEVFLVYTDGLRLTGYLTASWHVCIAA